MVAAPATASAWPSRGFLPRAAPGAPAGSAAPETAAPEPQPAGAAPVPAAPDAAAPTPAPIAPAPPGTAEAPAAVGAAAAAASAVPVPPPDSFVPLPVRPRAVRSKALKITTGVPPTTADLGSEADTLGATEPSDEQDPRLFALNENWSMLVKGYIRAPIRIGLGPSDASNPTDTDPDLQLHAPPRMTGMSSNNWAYINIAPNAFSNLRTTVWNSRVAATVVLAANQHSGVAFPNLDSFGGITQGYVTLKFPGAFGTYGGLAWTAGAYSIRYGYAGPRQLNAGYYGAVLFGRTRVAGTNVTANFDIGHRWELLVELGTGAEAEVLPILGVDAAGLKQMYIPGDPQRNLGPNFVHHGHVALWKDEVFKVAGHFLYSVSPGDPRNVIYQGEGSHLTVAGGEVRIDHPKWGHGYIGYSHIWAKNLLQLNDALQVVHGGRGYDFKLQYFGNKLRPFGGSGSFFPYESGTVHSILFQHKLYSNQLLGHRIKGPYLMLGVFGMFSRSHSPARPGLITVEGTTFGPGFPDYIDYKLKYGIEVLGAPFRWLSAGLRYDRVQPSSNTPAPENPVENPFGKCDSFWTPVSLECGQTYNAYTGYFWLLPDWNSGRRIILSYTHYRYGPHNYPDSPYSAIQKTSDQHLLMLSALISL
jgi:hypothetical protein